MTEPMAPDDDPLAYCPSITYQVDIDAHELVLFVEADRWEIRAAAKVLNAVIPWYHAQEALECAMKHGGYTDEEVDAKWDERHEQNDKLYRLIHELIYRDGETGLS